MVKAYDERNTAYNDFTEDRMNDEGDDDPTTTNVQQLTVTGEAFPLSHPSIDRTTTTSTTDVTTSSTAIAVNTTINLHRDTKKRKIHFRNYTPSNPNLIDTTDDTTTNTSGTSPTDPTTPVASTATTATSLSNATTRNTNEGSIQQKSVLQLALEKAHTELSNSRNIAITGATPSTMRVPRSSSLSTTRNNPTNNHVVPKNADLKRSIQSKLHTLEKRTQTALVCILRQRLEEQAQGANAN
jgi:cwf18 pre-mRNA splicing factor